MIRLGLCCIFMDEPIRFRRTTARALSRLSSDEAWQRLADICRHNARSLAAALAWCAAHGIGDFRINSQILPLRTHPEWGYDLAALPGGEAIVEMFRECGRLRGRLGLRASFHPDQFVLLNSPHVDVTARSLAELISQCEVAGYVGADVVNIHGGGVYGDRREALRRLEVHLGLLPPDVHARLTLENDDRSYPPRDLLSVCVRRGIPFVYDVHHHRCLADGLSEEEVTRAAVLTWDREPLFHVSSPRDGWGANNPRAHHDYLALTDFPACWGDLDLTVEVEAKAKERALVRLRDELADQGVVLWKISPGRG